jgi:hypothetical protein
VLGKLKFSAEVLLSTLRASRLLRSGSRLHHVLQVGINARHPGRPGLFDLTVDAGVTMSASSIARSSLSVDAVLLLLARSWQGDGGYYRFAWSDSTGLNSRQLLMSRRTQIPCDKIVEAMRVAHKLAWGRRHSERQLRAERQRAQGHEPGLDEGGSEEEACVNDCKHLKWQARDGPEPPELSAEERRRLCTFLISFIVPHVFVTISLGLGHTDLASKVEASLCSFMRECAGMQDLHDMCSSYRAYTVDMGAELGIAQFHGQLSQLLPPWFGSLPGPRTVPLFDIGAFACKAISGLWILVCFIAHREQVSAAMTSFLWRQVCRLMFWLAASINMVSWGAKLRFCA